MITSQVGINLIKSFEGCELSAYKPLPSELYWTIGYGHYGSDVRQGQTISQAHAETLLKQDLGKFEKGVSNLVAVPINQNQFDALVSFAYNCGLEALRTSTLLQKFNAGDVQGAADEFLKWDHAGGKELPGLLLRRKAEWKLFLTPASSYYGGSKPPDTMKYVVTAGDSLTKLALKFKTTVENLMEMNPSIKNPNKIFVGQVLQVPKK